MFPAAAGVAATGPPPQHPIPPAFNTSPPLSPQAMMEGIEAGDLTWHAMPHNAQTELYDAPLLEWAARFTHALDRRFKKREKLTMSQVRARTSGGCVEARGCRSQ